MLLPNFHQDIILTFCGLHSVSNYSWFKYPSGHLMALKSVAHMNHERRFVLCSTKEHVTVTLCNVQSFVPVNNNKSKHHITIDCLHLLLLILCISISIIYIYLYIHWQAQLHHELHDRPTIACRWLRNVQHYIYSLRLLLGWSINRTNTRYPARRDGKLFVRPFLKTTNITNDDWQTWTLRSCSSTVH